MLLISAAERFSGLATNDLRSGYGIIEGGQEQNRGMGTQSVITADGSLFGADDRAPGTSAELILLFQLDKRKKTL